MSSVESRMRLCVPPAGTPPQLNWENHTIRVDELCERVKNGKYEMNPKHQRQPVHDKEWQQELIEFLIINRDLNSLRFHPRYNPSTHRDVMESIDGKQRTNAITRFRNNEFRYHSNHSSTAHLNGKTYNDLPHVLRNEFDAITISIKVASRTMTDAEIRSTFINLQKAKQTKTGEHLNSLVGCSVRNICTEIVKKHADVFAYIVGKNGRYNHLEACVHFMYQLHHTVPDCNAPRLVEWAATHHIPQDSPMVTKLIEIIRSIYKIVKGSKLKRVSGKVKTLFHVVYKNPAIVEKLKAYFREHDPSFPKGLYYHNKVQKGYAFVMDLL